VLENRRQRRIGSAKASPASIDQPRTLLPYLPDEIVMQVDLANKRMVVDWESGFFRGVIGAVSLFPPKCCKR